MFFLNLPTMDMDINIKENIDNIKRSINECASLWERDYHDINLIAVSKRQPKEKIISALKAGHRLFGENKVQEAFEHWSDIKPLYDNLKLHLIGPLQSNKVRDAVKIFDCIETIDREKIAVKLSSELKKQNKKIESFIQINIGEEEQKSGISIKEFPEFFNFCKNDCDLDIKGLMCIPPAGEPASMYFALLKKIAYSHDIKNLSMGMSADFEKAISLGATHIRVGTKIFGSRNYNIQE